MYEVGSLNALKTYRKYYFSKSKSFKMVWNRGMDKPPQWWSDQCGTPSLIIPAGTKLDWSITAPASVSEGNR